MAGKRTPRTQAMTRRCRKPEIALTASAMPGRSHRTIGSIGLFGEVSARLPFFEDLPPDTLQCLSASGFGRGFLTVSLRARLRKAGYRDLGQLAQTSPAAIASIRKFGPVRVELVQTLILREIARWLPDARDVHTDGATRERRFGRLRDLPVERLSLTTDQIVALGCTGWSCADVAGRSRFELLGTGAVMSCDVDRIVVMLVEFLEGHRPTPFLSAQIKGDTSPSETETNAARRAALLAIQDREWEEAAPPRD